MRILLVNPPIYDFTAYDFWLKPYGLLRVGGMLRGRAELELLDFLDRGHPVAGRRAAKSDAFGRGRFPARKVPCPAPLAGVGRTFRRYGLPPELLARTIEDRGPFDVALVAGTMTYWYPGVREVIDGLRAASPATHVVLGGMYPTLCPDHARGLGPDLVVEGLELAPLWESLGIDPPAEAAAFWEGYPAPTAGAVKLADGCPCACTYCAVPNVYGDYRPRPRELVVEELARLAAAGVRNVAFYDDALLVRAGDVLGPVLEEVRRRPWGLALHTPNALHARLVTPEIARRMVRAGVRTFYLGMESRSDTWHAQTGGKVDVGDVARAVAALKDAGAEPGSITVYVIVGHPDHEAQEVAATIRTAGALGARVMLSEFSPVPGTPDGEAARRWGAIDEPLWHNKKAFTLARLGETRLRELKALARRAGAGDLTV